MSKIDFLRRMLLGCFTVTTAPTTAATTTTTTTTTTTQKRLSISLRDDILFDSLYKTHDSFDDDDDAANNIVISQMAPPRPSKSMVICTFFGHRGGSHSNVWFCVQLNRLSPKPSLLLELSLSTRNLVQEMRCGLLRIALECSSLEFSSCPLHLVPVWTVFCNGRRVGFSARRKPNQETRQMLKKMESITVGAGVIVEGEEELMYMRANYEWVIGGAHSQSFHLISPDDGPPQELSVFLLRSSSVSV